MGKQGPCRHCGSTSTPLWRNGPPDKPVLCNACGTRWRTKGSLADYTPMHVREPTDSEEYKVLKIKNIDFKPKNKKLPKIKKFCVAKENEREMPCSDQNFRKILEGDASNRSSSGSATSYSENCEYFGTTEASDLTASAQSNVWESQVPSKRRTWVMRPKPSPFEKLAKDLHTIMHEQHSYLSSSSNDVLIESETPMGSFEIGNGSVLLKYRNPKSLDDESEASSHATDNKSCIINEAYSASVFHIHSESKKTSVSAVGINNIKKSTDQGREKREKSNTENLHFLRDRDSPLCFTDLEDVVNFEVLMKNITNEEREKLIEYLPSLDIDKFPESLREMFDSSQFKENLTFFQQLLQGGVFGSSISDINVEDYSSLKTLVLQNLSTCTWVGYHNKLKDLKYKQYTGGKEVETGSYNFSSSKIMPLKWAGETQCSYLVEHQDSRSTLCNTVDLIDNDGSGFSSRSFFL